MPKKDLRQMKRAKLGKEDLKKAAKDIKVGEKYEEPETGDIENIEDTISKYEKKDESELISDLEDMVSEGKKDGSFSDEMLEAFMKNVSPMMDKEQRKKLEQISRMLKMNK